MQARVEKLEQLLAVSITEKDAALAERDAAVNAKNAAADDTTAALHQRDAAVDDKNAALTERDAAVVKQGRLLAELTAFKLQHGVTDDKQEPPTMSPALTLCVSGEDGSSHLLSAIRSPSSSKLGSKRNGSSATVRQVRITSVLDELEASQEECLELRDQVDTQAALIDRLRLDLRGMYCEHMSLDSASAQMTRLGGTSPSSAPPPLIAVQSARLSIPTPYPWGN